MQELPNEPHEHKTDQANKQPQPQLSTQVDSDSIHLDLDKKETYERLETFITTFVRGGTKKLNKYRDEISSKTNTTAEHVVEGPARELLGECNHWASTAIHPLVVTVTYIINRIHRKKAKRVVEVFRRIKEDELGNMLAEAGANIFHNYQIQFNMITDTGDSWARGMEKLATDATRRVINYVNQYKQHNPDMDVSVDLITEGVKLGKSRQGFLITVIQKIPKMPKLGHTVKIYDKKFKTSEVYENLVKKDDDKKWLWYSKKGNGSDSRKSKDTSGLTQILNEGCQEVIEQPEDERKYILSLEEVKEKAKETLNKINKEDGSFLQKSIMNEIKTINKKIDKMNSRPESIQERKPIYYNMKCPVKSFTGRGNELKCLHETLQNENGRVVISQVTAVTGLGGIGKTELVRKYATEYAKHYDNNVIWIDSETHESLTRSFKTLAAEELNILISRRIDGNMQERQVNSIVKDVYVHFINVKSLFIFDNAEEYTVIEKFLPTSLHPNAKRPYILITSRNRNWDVDDEGQIHVMQLDVFTKKEAAMFIENSIKIKDGLQKRDIEKLAKRLQYLPLALRQATAYINQEDEKFSKRGSERFKISDYLKKLNENTKLVNEGYYKISDRYSQTILTTWVITLEKIKEDQNHGMKAIDILNVMAYLAPDKIHASKMFDNDGVELCDKYSMIDLKKEGVASIHRLVQEVMRLMLKDAKEEEKVIKEALKLIAKNENISKENTSHVTSVWSYASGYSELIDEFYFNSNSIPTYDYNNATPLHLLAENGSEEAVKAILEAILMNENFSEKFRKIIDAKDKYNRTPLYMAVENGHTSVVKLFVDKEAKIDIKSTIVYNSLSTKKASDWTLLHVAAFNGYSDIVEILVNKDKTLVDIEDSIGRTAAVLAASSGQINVLKILRPKQYNVYLLHAKLRAARKSDNLEDIKNFLKNLEEEHQLQDIVNVKLGEWAPLHLAASANWLDIIETLITYGAKVKDDTPSFTPLHSASSNGHLAVIKYLIEKGAHPKDINEDGWTSLHAAAQNGHLHVVKYFIDEFEEIDVDIIDNARATPLHTAAFHGKLNVVEFLLRRGANIKAVNILGATPLFTAAINNNRDVYDFLLNEDATVVNASDDQTFIGRLNISVLHVAAVYNDKQMIEDLINKGVDKDIGKDTSLTPLYFATLFDSLEATEYLIASGAATNVGINIPIIREILEETVRDSTLKPLSMPKFISTLINFAIVLPDVIGMSANDLKSVIEGLCSLDPNFGALIDSLKIYVEQRKNPDLDRPLHAVFFTQEIGIKSKDDDG